MRRPLTFDELQMNLEHAKARLVFCAEQCRLDESDNAATLLREAERDVKYWLGLVNNYPRY